jgi:hypothetical protein
LAVEVQISNLPEKVTDEEFGFEVSISKAQAGTNYLRVSIYSEGSTNYFGLTFNNSEFYNGSEISQYLPINIDSSGNWTGKVKARIDPLSKYFKGSGDYLLKVRRYTQSGSSYNWSNPLPLKIDFQKPTVNPDSKTEGKNLKLDSKSTEEDSFVISNVPSSILSDQSIKTSVSLKMPNQKNEEFFLKGAFKKVDESNYFGLTLVDNNWIANGEKYTKQFKIVTDTDGNWKGEIEIKPDSKDSGFKGDADYIFKVAKYSGSGAGPTWSNDSNIHITDVIEEKTESIETALPDEEEVVEDITYQTEPEKVALIDDSKTQISDVDINKDGLTKPTYIKSDKSFNFIPVLGGILILTSASITVYRKYKTS